jgi:hypothetical protein
MRHYYEKIEGWFDFEQLYSEMVKKFPDNSHFVEIGYWLGKSSTYLGVEILNSGKKIKLDCIDSYELLDDCFRNHEHVLPHKDSCIDEFKNNIKPLKKIITFYKMRSVDTAKMYIDQSLDFVYIDASHYYEEVMKDINAWFPKIKEGGVIAGHDYNGCEVKKAVNKYFENKKLEYPNNSWVYCKI